MKRYQQTLINWTLRAVTVALLYAGIYHDIQGAMNIGLFMVWITIVSASACLSDSYARELAERYSPTKTALSAIYASFVFALLMWNNYVATAVFYFSAWVLMFSALHHGIKLQGSSL